MFKQEIIFGSIALLLVSCDLAKIPDEIPPEPPDLVILANGPSFPPNYCKTNGDNLVVSVYNRGLGTADTSMTRVDFVTHPTEFDIILLESISNPTPSLDSGESISLLFKMPSECFDPNCEFYVILDALDSVFETDEDNTFTGTCY